MSIFRRFLAIFAAPWRAWTTYRLDRLRIQADIAARPLETVLSMVKEMADAQREQTKVLQTWLEGFKVSEVPTSTVIRDEDEVEAERERRGKALKPAEVTRMFEDLVDFDMPE